MLSDSPPERDLEWTESGISGSYKFINKIWDLVNEIKETTNNKINDDMGVDLDLKLDETIISVTKNIESFQYNKAVANIYEIINLFTKSISNKMVSKEKGIETMKKISLLIQPFIPHLSEEIWSLLGGSGLALDQSWPKINGVFTKKINKIAVQINGKTKVVIEVDYSPDETQMLEIIKENKKIKKIILEKEINRVVYIQNKIINLVVK